MSASTTQGNFHQRLRFLDPDCLPPSFLDAITVTHRIGVRYLWIDSLCILQDSKDDWDHESSLMSDIYSNAYCTIAADVTTNSASGMFRAKELDEQDFIKFSVASDDGKPIMVQAFKREPLWDETLSSGILHKRGWCLQERELSSRIIHYTEKQVLWECRTLRASEGWPNRHVTKVKDVVQKITDQMEESENSTIYDLWHTAVRSYSSRRLTHGEDTLPALAGLARIVSERTNSDYFAGIWADDIRRSLAWYAGLDFTKHTSYVAPSWSWASGSGEIHFVYDEGRYETSTGATWASFGPPNYTPKKYTPVITGHNIGLRTSDPFSRIHSAELYVTAPVLDGVLRPDTKASSDEVPCLWIPLETKLCGIVNFDVRADASSIKVVRVIFLSLVVSDKGVGIAMVPVEGRECTYKRVGCVQDLDIVPFRSLKAESFTIV
jgi:hypothetical protein